MHMFSLLATGALLRATGSSVRVFSQKGTQDLIDQVRKLIIPHTDQVTEESCMMKVTNLYYTGKILIFLLGVNVYMLKEIKVAIVVCNNLN